MLPPLGARIAFEQAGRIRLIHIQKLFDLCWKLMFVQTPLMIPTPQGQDPLAKLRELSYEDQLISFSVSP